MEGEVLKARIQKIESNMAKVARKLNVSPQSLNQSLSAKDMKCGFVETLAVALNRPISYFFGEEVRIDDHSRHDDHSASFGSRTEHYENTDNDALLAKLKAAEDKLEFLKEQLKGKDETISALKSDIETKQRMIDYLTKK